MTRLPVRRARGEDGVVGGVEVLPLAVLILVAGALVVMNGWALVDAHLAVASAAREAIRTYTEAADDNSGWAAAQEAAARVMAGGGRDATHFTLSGRADGAGGERLFERCRRVTVTASYRVPAVAVPLLGGFGRGTTVQATATELVDPYRDGVGGGGCG